MHRFEIRALTIDLCLWDNINKNGRGQVVENFDIKQMNIKVPGRGAAKTVYILYLVALVIGITGPIGLIVAYVYKKDAPDWLKTHFDFQIWTFWIGLLYLVIGGVIVSLGGIVAWLIVVTLWSLWVMIRCVKGIKYLDRGEPYPDPRGFLF